MMKFALSGAGLSVAFAAACIAFAVPAQAQDEDIIADPTPEQAQAYIDAQSCAIILKNLGGEDNDRLAQAKLEQARELAPVNGDDTDEKFRKSYADMEMIIGMASDEEMQQFIPACQKAE